MDKEEKGHWDHALMVSKLIDEIERLRKALQYAVDQYGKPGGPWNVPGSKGSWIDQAKKALNYKAK